MMYMDETLYAVCVEEETGRRIDAKAGGLRVYRCYVQAYQVVEVCGSAQDGMGSDIRLLASPVGASGEDLAVIMDDAGDFYAAGGIFGGQKRCFTSLQQAGQEAERVAGLIRQNSKDAIVVME